MTVKDLILIDSSKVRRDSNLMLFYIESFFKEFGVKPNCAGCTFNSDWIKLVRKINGTENLVTLQKEKTMATFVLKPSKVQILSYKKDGRTFRKYNNSLTEEFVNEFLSNGSEDEINDRKKLFSKLPKIKDENLTSPEVKENKTRKPRSKKE